MHKIKTSTNDKQTIKKCIEDATSLKTASINSENRREHKFEHDREEIDSCGRSSTSYRNIRMHQPSSSMHLLIRNPR